MIVFVFAVCLAASTIGGVCGIGGGVMIKPLLDATGIMPVSTLSFLSGLTVLAMACISVYKNRKTNELDAKRSIPLGIGAAVVYDRTVARKREAVYTITGFAGNREEG